jgi:membrane protein required for colicin V production
VQTGFPGGGAYTGFDIVFALIILISTFAAFRKGLVRVLLSIGGLITGIVVASWNYVAIANGIGQWVTNRLAAEVSGFILIFILVVAAVTWVASLLQKTVKAVGLGFVDKLLGAVFGFLRGVLLGALALMALAAFTPDAEWLKNSQLAPYFLQGAHALSFVVPEGFGRQVSEGARYLLHETPELLRPHTLHQHM